MPPIAVLIVLVAVLLVFAYGIPTARQRLEQRTQAVTLAQAAATADAITGEQHQAWQGLLDLPEVAADGQTSAEGGRPGALRRSLDLYATAPGAEIRVVNRDEEVVAREGERLFSPPPEMLRKAAGGSGPSRGRRTSTSRWSPSSTVGNSAGAWCSRRGSGRSSSTSRSCAVA